MGSLILCHKKKAAQPYEIARVRRRIYTVEELCYYLCNNLYLIDYTIMNEKLCEWLDIELEMKDLAKELRELLKRHGTIEQFVLKILGYAKIYSQPEMTHIQNVLERLRNQKDIERQKYKADNLLESGECESAVLVYLSILQEKQDETADERFCGRIYGCLGTAYGREMMYEEAAAMYEKAYELCGDDSMLAAYLYSCSRYMPEDEYQGMISKNSRYIEMAKRAAEKENILKNGNVPEDISKETLEKWKEEYRKY